MVKLTYALKERGWALIDAELGECRFRFPVSYMSDALDDLVSATIAVLLGQPVARFVLIDEPGAYCWILAQRQPRLNITILHLGTMYCLRRYEMLDQIPPDEEFASVASVECTVCEFVSGVAGMLREIESQYTLDDFKRSRNPALSPRLNARLGNLLEKSDSSGALH